MSAASLWPPRLTSPLSAWNGHIPFAGWIIEATRPGVFVELGTHAGVSYFAFCESVSRLGIGTRCYAVDTWVGDEHAGAYGEEIYDDVAALNAAHFAGFSTLVRRTFDEAVHEFDDGSIDLLHIDGYHTYEAVRHDFETWLPKLSDRAVVLLHDTNERKEDFGVYRFMAELAEQYPSFEFTHEHGLGVVCVGENVPPAVAELVGIDDPSQIVEIRDVYAALGKRLGSEVESDVLRDQRDDAREKYAAMHEDRDRVVEERARIVADRNRLRQNLDDMRADREKNRERFEDVRRTLAEERRDLKHAARERDEARRVADRLSSELQATSRDLERVRTSDAVNTNEVRRLQERESALRQAIVEKEQRIIAGDQMYDELKNRRSVRSALALARVTRPVFRAVRGGARGGAPELALPAPEVAEDPAVPAALPIPKARTSEVGNLGDVVDRPETNPVTIVVPIHNAFDDVKRCVEALAEHTTSPAQLLLINDASTDKRIPGLLETYAGLTNTTVLTNDSNLGYTATVNRGIAESPGDVVLINSDARVAPGWLERLRLTARLNPTAGTITATSNNAGAFSAPEIGANPLPL